MLETWSGGRLLRTRDWPGGLCPIHILEGTHCDRNCIHSRIALAQIAAELERYWQSPAFQRRAAQQHERKVA